MRIDADVKSMAERASAAMGCASLTEFVTRLIREHAPAILKEQATIELTNGRQHHFRELFPLQPVREVLLRFCEVHATLLFNEGT